MGTGRTCLPCRSPYNLRVSLYPRQWRSRPRGSDPVPTRLQEADGSHPSRQEETFSWSRATVLVQDFRCALPDVRASEPDTGRAGTGGHCTAKEQTPPAMNSHAGDGFGSALQRERMACRSADTRQTSPAWKPMLGPVRVPLVHNGNAQDRHSQCKGARSSSLQFQAVVVYIHFRGHLPRELGPGHSPGFHHDMGIGQPGLGSASDLTAKG